jgi:integrating conjugative element protein (TIGR03757 family)
MSMALRRAILAVSAVLALHGPAIGAAEPAVEVYTLSTLPVTNARDATVYYLDAIALLEQHLSQNLPPDPARAQQVVTQRMAALGSELESRTRAGAAGLARVAQLELQRAPAIVFDGKWAVYGVTDVDVARRLFARVEPAHRR